jgi:hypothetical protein
MQIVLVEFFQNDIHPGALSTRRRISRRSICSSMMVIDHRNSFPERHFHERWLWQTTQQNEAPPMEFYCSLEERCSGESCSAGVRNSAKKGFFRRATCLVFALGVFNRYAEHLRKPGFFAPAVF